MIVKTFKCLYQHVLLKFPGCHWCNHPVTIYFVFLSRWRLWERKLFSVQFVRKQQRWNVLGVLSHATAVQNVK